MNSQIADEIVEELASTFQRLETQSAALLEFVKDKGIVKEDDLAPYMERAGAASAVRWRATRVRMARLLASAESGDGHAKENGKATEQESSKSKQGDEHSQNRSTDKDDKKSMKQAESLATEPVEAQAEDDRAKRKKDRSEKPVQKSSNAREDQEKSKVEAAGQQQPPKEHSEKRTGAGDHNSATKQGQSSATSSRSDNDKDRQKTDRENEDRKNVA
jgi:hypothetical protein